ncbi:MAG: hypothetical protein ABIH76_02715, partial [Candidatus Bathyarchaeota archaeon]
YGKIKNIWFFVIFGAIYGILVGEAGALGALPGYIIIILIYALAYRKITWWKVALTAFIAGILIENIVNRAQIQAPTLMWAAILIPPYFYTKIFENRRKISVVSILGKLRWTFVASVVLAILAAVITRNNISPPLIIFFFATPSLFTFLLKTFRRKT